MADHVPYIGRGFAYGGRGPDSFDCYGLVMALCREDGIVLPDYGHASDQPHIAAMMGCQLTQWQLTKPEKGAVVLMRVGRYVSHCGYLIDPTRMVHTWEKSGGVVIERLDTWKQRIVGFYRYAG